MEGFINSFFTTLQTLLTWVLDGVTFVVKGVFWFILDGVLTAITTFLSLLDVGSHITSFAGYFGLLPPQLIWLIQAIGLPQGLSILIWAIVIRMTINLIPSWITRL